jgi:hypothetical protein
MWGSEEIPYISDEVMIRIRKARASYLEPEIGHPERDHFRVFLVLSEKHHDSMYLKYVMATSFHIQSIIQPLNTI